MGIFFISGNIFVLDVFSASLLVRKDTLKEVEVRAKKLPANKHAGNPIQILDKSDFEKLNATSVADVVKHLSGVQLKDYGGIGGLKTINVRSLGSNHTGIFYDGVLLGNAQNGEIDLGKFSLDNIENLALYNGQNSTELQTARSLSSASSLYLKSRIPRFSDNERTHGILSIKTGSFGLINPSLLIQQKITNSTFASFNAEWQNANGEYKYHYINGPLDSIATRTNTDVNAWRIEAGLNGRLQDSSQWSVKVFNYQSARGLPGATIVNGLSSERLWDKDAFIQSTYEKPISKLLRLIVNAKYAESSTHYNNPNFAGTTIDDRFWQNELYVSVAAGYQFSPSWKVNLSTDFFVNGMDANSERFANPTRKTTLIALVSELRIKTLTLQGSLLSTFVTEKVEIGNNALDKRIFSPFISASWTPFNTSNLRFRGFYKDVFRMPTFNDLYYTSIGSIDLKPEYTRQFDLGFSYSKAFSGHFQYLNFHVDGYFNKIKNKIVAIPTANLFRWTMVNLGRVDIYGVEAGSNSSIKLAPETFLTIGLNYTFQKALDVTPNGMNFQDFIPYAPQHTGVAAISMDVRKYSFNYNYTYTGDRYSLRPNIAENYMLPWQTHDVSASRSFQYAKVTFKTQIEVNNLLNQFYDVVRNFPMPGRSLRMSFAMNF